MSQFPFFMKVSTEICKMVEESMVKINETVDISQEKESLHIAESYGMTM